MINEQIAEYLNRLGIDRWSNLRTQITEARDVAARKGEAKVRLTFDFVLTCMEDAEAFEAVATEIRRAQLAGDEDALMRALARMDTLGKR